MAMAPIFDQADLGRRIAQARDDAGMTQAQLAAAIGLDRTAVAKLEAGTRKVSAAELVATSAVLDRPIDWFVFESPPAVVSRRQDPAVGGRSRSLDRMVERLGRDVAFLVDQGILPTTTRPLTDLPADFAGVEMLASQARELMHVPAGPLHDLQRVCERVGLLAFSIELGDEGGDAAYVEVGDLGVALVNGSIDPGRRRFNLGHELGHHIVGDAYAPETAVAAGSETERMLNAFAAHLLMPRGPVSDVWSEYAPGGRRLAAIAISVRFRVSWTSTCNHLRNLGLIEGIERDDLANAPPTRGDFFELGEHWVSELDAPAVPPDYGRRVVSAYKSAKLTASRTAELLWGTVSVGELPELDNIPLEGLRREFDALR